MRCYVCAIGRLAIRPRLSSSARIGLGVLPALFALLILWFARLSAGGGDPGEQDDGEQDEPTGEEPTDEEPIDEEPADDEQASKERQIVLHQLYVGAFLVVAGALIAVFALKWFDGQKGFALAIGTAVIGGGLAIIPPGAAAGAGERAKERAGRRATRRNRAGTHPPEPRNGDGRAGDQKQGPQRGR
jgi:hypothetical protein